MRLFRVNINWSRWSPGQILKEDELPTGTDIERSIQRGTITPIEDGMTSPLGDKDAKGWKARAEAFEQENQRLRTASPSAEMLAELEDLKKVHDELNASHDRLTLELEQYRAGSVPKSVYDETNSKFLAANAAFDRVNEELTKLKGPETPPAETPKPDEGDGAKKGK